MINHTTYARIVEVLGGCILSTILVAGLWPFRAPKNHVKWMDNQNGLAFSRFGSILSLGAFPSLPAPGAAAGSLEIWLKPWSRGSTRTILSFEGSDHPGVPFSVRQFNDALLVYRYNVDAQGIPHTTRFEVNRAFRDKNVFVTITLSKQDTSVYLDGILSRVSPSAGSSTNNMTGRLVLANSPSSSDNWAGVIRGLAIYDRQLSSAQVAQHYEAWTKSLKPALAQDESPVALYLFSEGRGNLVRNELDSSTSLTIPERYFVLHPEFLSPPWREYHATWGYWEDVAVNIAGFIPLGAWALVYFSSVRPLKSPVALAILMGFSISLTIEVLQSFLPTRSSGITDVITNTLGTVIGLMFCYVPVIRDWLMTPQRCRMHVVITAPKLETAVSA
jgi:VanZ family protein